MKGNRLDGIDQSAFGGCSWAWRRTLSDLYINSHELDYYEITCLVTSCANPEVQGEPKLEVTPVLLRYG